MTLWCSARLVIIDFIILNLTMDIILKWASTEIKSLMPGGILEDDDIKMMVENLLNLDSASINQEISGLLDYSKKEVKKFIKDFIERVEN